MCGFKGKIKFDSRFNLPVALHLAPNIVVASETETTLREGGNR